MLAELDPHAAWYVARAAGWVAWGLALCSLVWGLALSSRLIRRQGAPAWFLDLHRFLSVLTVVFTAVHLAGLWGDNWLHLATREMVVPMASSAYRPVAVTYGVVALYLLVAVVLSSAVRRRLPRRAWHRLHLLSLPLVVLATLHGFTAGSDRGVRLQWAATSAVAVVVFVSTFRLLSRRRPRRPSPAPA